MTQGTLIACGRAGSEQWSERKARTVLYPALKTPPSPPWLELHAHHTVQAGCKE